MGLTNILLSTFAVLSLSSVDGKQHAKRTFSDKRYVPAHLHATTTRQHQHVSHHSWSLDSILSSTATPSTVSTVPQAKSFDNSTFTPAALADEVHTLPGLVDDINFRHFSGYVNASADGNKHIHYWYV